MSNFKLLNNTRCMAFRRVFEKAEPVRLSLVALVVGLTSIFSLFWVFTQNSALLPWIAVFVTLFTILQGLPPVVDALCPHPLRSAAILELDMTCHEWKNEFMNVFLGGLAWKPNSQVSGDIWAKLAASAEELTYTDDNMERGRYLTQNTNKTFIDNLVMLADVYGDQLSSDLRLQVLSTISRVRFHNSLFSKFEEPWLKIFAEKGIDWRGSFGRYLADLVNDIGKIGRVLDALNKQRSKKG